MDGRIGNGWSGIRKLSTLAATSASYVRWLLAVFLGSRDPQKLSQWTKQRYRRSSTPGLARRRRCLPQLQPSNTATKSNTDLLARQRNAVEDPLARVGVKRL